MPTPLPNIGRSGLAPKGYSTKVTIDGNRVAIRGATFGSMGDIAAQATGGGIVWNNVEGPTKFVGPGSMNVFIEGKNVQLLSDPMLNNCGPSGTPPNAATMMGVLQDGLFIMDTRRKRCPLCHEPDGHGNFGETQETKADATQLANAFERHLSPRTLEGQPVRVPNGHPHTMLAVLHGECGRVWGDQSSFTSQELCDAIDGKAPATALDGNSPRRQDAAASASNVQMSRAGQLMTRRAQAQMSYFDYAANAPTSRRGKFADKNGRHRAAVVASIRSMGPLHVRALDDVELSIESARTLGQRTNFQPPGSCAGLRVLVLAHSAGCLPAAITERWHGEREMGAELEFIIVGEAGHGRGPFVKGQSVPPCDTCAALLPLLRCWGSLARCEHT